MKTILLIYFIFLCFFVNPVRYLLHRARSILFWRIIYLLITIPIISGLSNGVNAQKNADIGIFLGGSYYLGDINPSLQFYSTKPAFGGIFRYNINCRYSVRGSIIIGILSGNDQDFNSQYQKIRNHKFTTTVSDYTAEFEFNYLPYITANEKYVYSTYVSAGFTFLIASKTSNIYQVAIPFGVGFKFNLTNRLSAGLQWSFRRTFYDGLDQLYVNFDRNGKQQNYIHNSDWYSFAGVFITYKLYHGELCPAYW